ncbi:MAG: ATP-dependent DNA helicase RecG [Granulosicoccus sp.]
MRASLDTVSVETLKGVGAAMSAKLGAIGIQTLQDVLFHLPFRYQDRTRLSRIGELRPGQEALVCGEVLLAEVLIRQRRSLLVRINDGSGTITLRFFHFSQAQVAQFAQGKRVQCFGEIRRGPGMLEIVHPEYRLLADDASMQVSLNDTLTPFYHTTEGVQQGTFRKLTDQALAALEQQTLIDHLSAEHVSGMQLPDLCAALRIVHRPPPNADVAALVEGVHPAHRRLALEELVAHRLGLRLLRVRTQTMKAPLIRPPGKLMAQLKSSLSFNLTNAQSHVLREVVDDMGTPEPMLRLVQGDVGSGKTIVAALAAAQAVESGYQVAMMAPTEILAEQHMLNFSAWFESLGIGVVWLTGKLRAAARRASIEAIAMGHHKVVVGTHALFQTDVEFANLGLAIIDEQHRFGVHQRMALRNKGADKHSVPHQLIMTATPIPRTLAMTAYADLDVSVIDELPPGRKPVTTVALDNARRVEVVERVGAAIDEGRQVYWVCTLIEESESMQAEAAEDTLLTLQELLPDCRVAMVHGRLKGREKELIMQSFKQQDVDLLVATTVIEVGVDVPNASLMIIENAERLGLSQLHQLRGRVGRGSAQSSCILMYQSPLSNNARERLGIMRKTNDGFVIAQKDLELRGAGEVLGTRQTGLASFKIAQLGRDDDLLDEVTRIADDLLAGNAFAVNALVQRWIGEGKKDYGGV